MIISFSIPGSLFVKRLWTLSRTFISFMRYGFQATEEYSKIGLTYTLYDAINDWMFFEWKQRMIKLALLCALRDILAI